MTTVTVNGIGNFNQFGNMVAWSVLYPSFTFSSSSDSSFSASNSFAGTLNVFGTGFAYSSTNPLITSGTVTSVTFTGGTGTGGSSATETWTGLNVSAVAAYNALIAGDQTTFDNLFFGGDDTFNFSASANPAGGTAIELYGLGGNDVFNINGWSSRLAIDGGTGSNTVNVSGGIAATPPVAGEVYGNALEPDFPNFSVYNVGTVNLAAGANYSISLQGDQVAAGSTMTVDGSQLGASNSLTFITAESSENAVVAGNLVLLGGAGNDFFQGGSGNNTFNGGGGTNTVDFYTGIHNTGVSTGVTVNLSVAGPQSIGGPVGGIDTFINIQNLIGTTRNDTLTGDGNNNVFDGGGGNDAIDGGGGTDTVVFSQPFADYTITHSGATTTISGPGGTDTLTNVELAQFSDQTVPISGLVLTTSNISAQRGQVIPVASMFSVADYDGSPITEYQLWDSVDDPTTGHFVVNGVVQQGRTVIDITAAQLAQTTYVAGDVSENLQIRAFDGVNWSAPAAGAWAPFTVSVPPNHPPVVTTANITLQHGQSVAASSLFTVSDADGDPITEYQLWDSVDDPSTGHFVVNGVAQQGRTVIDITAAQLAQTTYVAGAVGENLQIRASDGIDWSAPAAGAWSPFTVTVPQVPPPILTTAGVTLQHGQSVAVSSLFTVTDPAGNPITEYQLWDSVDDPSTGHFVVNGVVEQGRTVIDITAAQLAQTTYVAGAVGENLQIRAFDGVNWSAPAAGAWAPFTVSVPPNHPPVLTTANVTLQAGQSVAASSLFTVSDADGDPITEYQLWDSVDSDSTGHFVVNGVAQQGRTVIDITATQLAQTTYVAGAVGENLQIRAFDGYDWSAPAAGAWAPFTVSVPAAPQTPPPILTTAGVTLQHGQSVAVSSLFTVTDPAGNPITEYQLWDSVDDPSTGHFVVNGVVEQGRTVIDITAAQLAQTTYVAGAVGENLQIRAFDGVNWSAPAAGAWAPFTVSVPPNHPPVLTTANVTLQAGQSVAASSLFTVSDADGDPITEYQLWDSVDSDSTGHFVVNGVAQQGRTVIDITATQLAQTTYVAGAVGENLQIRAFDGYDWSAPAAGAWAPFTVSVPAAPQTPPPILTTAGVTLQHGQSVAVSSLFTVTDPAGNPITEYQLWDSVDDPSTGHFVVNGVVEQGRTVIDITAAQLAQTTYVAGAVGENLQIRAFDGANWSAPAAGAWAPFHVSIS